jgi:DNA processing protein
MVISDTQISPQQLGRAAYGWTGEVWVRGTFPDLSAGRPVVAIVGARAASRSGMESAFTMAAGLTASGATIVSGGALGIDGAAHRGALSIAGGQTIVVLGTGVDVPYPRRHRALFDEIALHRGALISPFPYGTPPRTWHFPRRNGLIAALADGVVVVEAELRSGALGTAGEARRRGRRVMAVPGTPGCDALVLAGAFAVETADEVLRALAGERRKPTAAPIGDLSVALAACPLGHPLTVDEIALRSGLPPMVAHAALLRLSLLGRVARLSGERFQRLEQST